MDRRNLNLSAAMALFQRRHRHAGMTAGGKRADKGLLNAAMLFRRERGRRGILAGWPAAMFGERRRRPPSESDET